MNDKKQNKQDIPPLLPLEYCTVERAARLLGCEVEDIYHWHEVGAIQLYVYFDKDVISTANLGLLSNDNRESPTYSERQRFYDWIMSGADGELIPIIDNVNCIILKGIFGEFFWNSDDWEIQPENSPCYKQYVCNGAASGLWLLGRHNEWDNSLDLVPPSHPKMNMESGIELFIHINVSSTVWDGTHYLIKDDLQKLHTAIQTGTPLPNRYNDPEIAAKKREQEKQAGKQPTRLRSEQVALTQELVKRVLDLENIDQPSKQAEALLIELSSSVPVEDLPSARSITRYLGGK